MKVSVNCWVYLTFWWDKIKYTTAWEWLVNWFQIIYQSGSAFNDKAVVNYLEIRNRLSNSKKQNKHIQHIRYLLSHLWNKLNNDRERNATWVKEKIYNLIYIASTGIPARWQVWYNDVYRTSGINQLQFSRGMRYLDD